MAITYKVVSKRPGGIAGENTPRYYPILTGRETVDLKAICNSISKRSTFSTADVMGVVQSFIELVPEILLEGNNVKMDGFGTFSVHASGKGKGQPEEVSARDISKLKVSFLPDKQIKKKLSEAAFVKAKKNVR